MDNLETGQITSGGLKVKPGVKQVAKSGIPEGGKGRKIALAERVTAPAMHVVYICACGRVGPEPGVAPLGEFMRHCIKYHTDNPLLLEVKPLCSGCHLARVERIGDLCNWCISADVKRDAHKAFLERITAGSKK